MAITNLFRAPILTRRRIWMAFAVALAADGLQIALGPFGWLFFDDVFDVIAMIATISLIGFHPLLLPTFIIELLPVADMLPSWTGCVAIVVLLRKRQQRPPPPADDPSSKIIDI